MTMSHTRKALLAGLAGVLAATATMLGVAQAAPSTSVAAAAAETEMPYALEDFSYPYAGKIQADTGVVLKHGDGHLLMTTCDGTQDILIESRFGAKQFCFNVTARPAYLALEIPQAYGIWTSDDPVKTSIKEESGATQVVSAPANDFTGYGEASDASNPTMLIELRITG
ncbi:hypothetical protein GCM10017562_67080 [Streptomyces roseofulvus]|uniref:hypothetical protein n=1 Tax=Streptomyces roseofulvus TaxID=33902 RepID=UPI0031FC900A